MRPHRHQYFRVDDALGTAHPQAAAASTVTPSFLRSLYNVGSYTANRTSGASLGVAGFLEEYAKYSDLSTFLKKYTTQDPTVNNFTYALVNGGLDKQNDSTDDDVEANLDVQYALSLAYNTPATFYSTGGLGPLVPDLDQPSQPGQNEPYSNLLQYLIALPDSQLPTTLSVSYGEDEQSIPSSYTNSTCSLFAQLGARGVSVLFSSGDTGVGSACEQNFGNNATRFLPVFPASCPFVTSVGGTTGSSPEKAVSFSSGGFSDRFPRPSYQDTAVTTYLTKLGTKWQGLYNPAGRGFPDVAAQSENFQVVDHGSTISVQGTSCAAPTFAGIVSLLNSARLSAGKPPLGFLNPFIYSSGFNGLTDITAGGSTGCTGTDQYSGLKTPRVIGASWNATAGWDPVTGYGTPNFQNLLPLALAA